MVNILPVLSHPELAIDLNGVQKEADNKTI